MESAKNLPCPLRLRSGTEEMRSTPLFQPVAPGHELTTLLSRSNGRMDPLLLLLITRSTSRYMTGTTCLFEPMCQPLCRILKYSPDEEKIMDRNKIWDCGKIDKFRTILAESENIPWNVHATDHHLQLFSVIRHAAGECCQPSDCVPKDELVKHARRDAVLLIKRKVLQTWRNIKNDVLRCTDGVPLP